MKNLAAKVIKNRVLVLLAIAIVIMGAVLVMPAKEIQTPFFGKTITVGFAGQASAAVVLDYTVDGTADQVQINQALNALPASGGMVQLLAGTYNITAAIVIPKGLYATSGYSLVGLGRGATVINCQFNGGHSIQSIGNSTSYNYTPSVSHMSILGNGGGTKPTSDGIYYEWCKMSQVDDIEVMNFSGCGLWLLDCWFPYVNHLLTDGCGLLNTKPSVWLGSGTSSTNEGSMYDLVLMNNYGGSAGALNFQRTGSNYVNVMWVYGLQVENPGGGAAHCVVMQGDQNGIVGATLSSPGASYDCILNTGFGNVLAKIEYLGPAKTILECGTSPTSGYSMMASNIVGYAENITNGMILDGLGRNSVSGFYVDGVFSGFGIKIDSNSNQITNIFIAGTGNDTVELNGDHNFVTNAVVDEAPDDNGANNTVTYTIP